MQVYRSGAMLTDPWLEPWLPLMLEATGSDPVLEIGCGLGDDTSTLTNAGLQVTAFDFSIASVAATRIRVPTAVVAHGDS